MLGCTFAMDVSYLYLSLDYCQLRCILTAGFVFWVSDTSEDFYKRMYIALCLFQLLQSTKLLVGVIGVNICTLFMSSVTFFSSNEFCCVMLQKSRRLLESWLVYNGLMVALALLAHLRNYYSKEFDSSNDPQDDRWFWSEFFPKFGAYFVVNAIVIFVVHELWHYLTEEMKAGGRSADIGYCRCFSNQSWMTFVGCANRVWIY